VYLRPRTRFVAGFLGEVNWIDGAGVRPEATRVCLPSQTGVLPAPARQCSAVVTGLEFLGDRIQVHTLLSSGEHAVAQLTRGQPAFGVGDPVEISWHPDDEMRFD
jgi:ABC-type Fe3+/spermidine/putrescine transport system ATPase subunit